MARKYTAAFTAILLFFAISAYSQQQNAEQSYPVHFVGLSASSISGMGLSYGYKFLPEYMFKINGIYVESRDKNTNISGNEYYIREIYWDCGAEIQRDLFNIPLDDALITGYGLIGGSYWDDEYNDPETPQDNEKSRSWTGGIAIGLRLILCGHVSVNVELGYQYSRDFNDASRYAGIGGGTGIHLTF